MINYGIYLILFWAICIAASDSLLVNAVERQNIKEVKALISQGVSINEEGGKWFDRTPLYEAVRQDSEVLVSLLLANGADINMQGSSGLTPLHCSVLRANVARFEAIVLLLLKHGADPNVQDCCGNTALHKAVEWGNERVVRLLLENRVNIFIKNKYGNTAYDDIVNSLKILDDSLCEQLKQKLNRIRDMLDPCAAARTFAEVQRMLELRKVAGALPAAFLVLPPEMVKAVEEYVGTSPCGKRLRDHPALVPQSQMPEAFFEQVKYRISDIVRLQLVKAIAFGVFVAIASYILFHWYDELQHRHMMLQAKNNYLPPTSVLKAHIDHQQQDE